MTKKQCRTVRPLWAVFYGVHWIFSESFQEFFSQTQVGNQTFMDSTRVILPITECRYLKQRFEGVFSAATFPMPLNANSFSFADSEIFDGEEQHWRLIYNKDGMYLFTDPLGLRLDVYEKCEKRLSSADFSCEDLLRKALQPAMSNLLEIHCKCLGQILFSGFSRITVYWWWTVIWICKTFSSFLLNFLPVEKHKFSKAFFFQNRRNQNEKLVSHCL